jgi:hypothetical protein
MNRYLELSSGASYTVERLLQMSDEAFDRLIDAVSTQDMNRIFDFLTETPLRVPRAATLASQEEAQG